MSMRIECQLIARFCRFDYRSRESLFTYRAAALQTENIVSAQNGHWILYCTEYSVCYNLKLIFQLNLVTVGGM